MFLELAGVRKPTARYSIKAAREGGGKRSLLWRKIENYCARK